VSNQIRTVRNDAALKALQHAERILEILVEIAEHGESDAARVSADDKILDLPLGKRRNIPTSRRASHRDRLAIRNASKCSPLDFEDEELAQLGDLLGSNRLQRDCMLGPSLGEDQGSKPDAAGHFGYLSGTLGDAPITLMFVQLNTR
jgi:hypothetical protein